jgi:alpha-galactosidase
MSGSAIILLCCTLTFSQIGAQKADVDSSQSTSGQPGILTPPTAHTPGIHGPKVFGVRPGSPFLYTIPATGDRPLRFGAKHLPAGLRLDAKTGRITGTLHAPGTFDVLLTARNSLGKTERRFTIRVGDEISLTPPMGWNSYNVWGAKVTADEAMAAAKAMVDSGLSQHGFTYINIDDGWQGLRGGPLNAVQPDPNAFPDFAKLAADIHAMGLKVGIYHTPWVSSYGRRIGASSMNPEGAWDKSMADGPRNRKILPHAIGTYHFMKQDAQKFAQWGVDYLKYDWAPVEAPETREMDQDLRATGRDIVFSLSNNATNSLLGVIAQVAPEANLWRTNHDIDDSWKTMSRNGFDQDAWAPYARPGHFNDPDMLVVGVVGWGHPHPTRLTQDEQYTHVSLWCLSAAPLILGNKLEDLDDFTRSLLTNDEVLDLDQDSLGKQATVIAGAATGAAGIRVYAKPLEDGSFAIGLFNLSTQEQLIGVQWSDLGIHGSQFVRDLWRQKDLGQMSTGFSSSVAPHGVRLIRIFPASRRGSKAQ